MPENWMDRKLDWTILSGHSLSPEQLRSLREAREDEPTLVFVRNENGETVQMPVEMFEEWTRPVSKFGRDADWWLSRQFPEIHKRLEDGMWLETAIRRLDRKARVRYAVLTGSPNPLPPDEAKLQTEQELIYITEPGDGPPVWAAEELREMENALDIME